MSFDIQPLKIKDAFLLKAEPFRDVRGSFEVFWEKDALSQAGIGFEPLNAHHSYNTGIYTLRGMHYQSEPHGQDKLVSCVSGSVFDVMVDMRRESPTFLQWEAVYLRPASGISVFIPKGCAHGFLTLAPDTTVAYLIGGAYDPSAAAVVRWDDPKVGIDWPYFGEGLIISEKDKQAPFL